MVALDLDYARRGVAVARRADLEIQSPKLPRSIRLTTDELLQVNPKLYKARQSSIFGKSRSLVCVLLAAR